MWVHIAIINTAFLREFATIIFMTVVAENCWVRNLILWKSLYWPSLMSCCVSCLHYTLYVWNFCIINKCIMNMSSIHFKLFICPFIRIYLTLFNYKSDNSKVLNFVSKSLFGKIEQFNTFLKSSWLIIH